MARGMIFLYKKFLSPLLPPACRFRPTCSDYCSEALEQHGFFRGGWLGFKRLMRCNPLFKGGYDPVPGKKSRDKETGLGGEKEARERPLKPHQCEKCTITS
ncbi:MAG: membrane protein insertion efficiency factor YidD [Planctomycetota bacterium]|nr:membrane protein insertion efficiency factor YidD [Planctomycetota bacterium]